MMKMSRLRGLALLLIVVLAIGLSYPFGDVLAITPQDQTIHITDTHDDAFITETGILIDTSLVTILDPGLDIISFLVFNDVEINYWEPLENATLRLRTSTTLDFDADSSVTIYGMKWNELQDVRPLTASDVLAIPSTTALVNYNTSQFYGQAWHEINVTDIVEELIRAYHWDGDGIAGTETGDSIGFKILGPTDEGRWFYDYSIGNGLEAQLVIHWNHEPPPPAGAPTADFNETYRGYHIWSLDPILDPTKTGDGCDVNWNLVNLTDLSVHDSGASTTVNNDTMVTGATSRASYTLSVYNDTGSANINTFYQRWRLNMTNVFTSIFQDDPIVFFGALSTSSPTGGAGMSYGTSGEWIGLIGVTNQDDTRWAVYIKERSGAVDVITDKSQWYNEMDVMLYFECFINMTAPIIRYRIYNDPDFTSVNVSHSYVPVWAVGPFRYSQFVAGMGVASQGRSSYHAYSYLESPVDLGVTTWIVTDENGTTIADGLDDYDDAIDVIEDELGADPENPDPPAEEWPDEGPFTRFRTRGYFFAIGYFLFWGPVWFMAWKRPSGYYVMAGLLVMLIGVGFLIAVGGV